MQSTLKAVEKEWRMLFNEELGNLELDLCVRSGRVEGDLWWWSRQEQCADIAGGEHVADRLRAGENLVLK